jgi:chaperonin GroES
MKSYKLQKLLQADNIAEILDDNDLVEIGHEAKDGYKQDEESRADWLSRNEEWMKLALQVMEKKQSPWQDSSNIKYPLITLAAIQFHARAYPSLVPSSRVVKVMVVGEDPTGAKAERARRLSKHMSWQVLQQMRTWEPEMDKALLVVPILGCVFKKTYFDPIKRTNCSEMVLPRNLVVDYWAKSLSDAHRVTQLIELSSNQIHSYQKGGLFLDIPLQSADYPRDGRDGVLFKPTAPTAESVGMRNFLEQHTWIDLDGDGYQEPYIVTLHEESGQVLRIKARYTEDTVYVNSKNEVIYIDPIEYFTKFPFIPSPDGGFYDLGFGVLLGPLNATANTLFNQLIDAGTLANTQGGFLGRGLRIKEGTVRFRPGEWKVVNASGNDIAKSVYPLPVRDPSQVLFNLLNMSLEAGQRLSSTVDIMVGETPGQNTPATTTMAAIDQGSKVITAIYKRLHTALKEEFRKLFYLNSVYLDPQEYFTVLDDNKLTSEQAGLADYNQEDLDVIPAADPSVSADSMRLAKANGLMELIRMGTINPQEATMRVLEAQDQDNIPALVTMPPPQPNPEIQLEQMKIQLDAQLRNRELDIKEKLAEIQRLQVLSQVDKAEADKELTAAKTFQTRAQAGSQVQQILQGATQPNDSNPTPGGTG